MTKEELTELENKRYKLLRWIYDEYQRTSNRFVNIFTLVDDKLEYQEKYQQKKELSNISSYLSGKGLVSSKRDDGLIVWLEQKGIEEVEDSIRNPNKSTEYFPSTVINNYISGNNYGGINQQTGTNNIQINMSESASELEQKINELIEAVKSSSLSEVQKISTESHLQTIQKLTKVEITPEVSQEVESRIVAIKDVLATTADLVSLGQVVLPMIAYFFHVSIR